MTTRGKWLLPEGIEEVLPPQAAVLNRLCGRVIDLFESWGYELVFPPLVEYLDSLLIGTGEDLDLQTFKLTDQLSGRLMGIRADITPQVARIDAHKLKRETPSRLCYVGSVLHTRPAGHGGTRSPLQTGAELYGHAGIESDAEIISLMLKTLQLCGLQSLHVDLGHVGIYRGLVSQLEINTEQESILFNSLQRKATAELKSEIDDWSISTRSADMLFALLELNGGIEILDNARKLLAGAGDAVLGCLDDINKVVDIISTGNRAAPLHVDLAELRGYHYHTGIMFSTYSPGQGQEVARGGRYDDIGRAFGRARPAVGFSLDLKSLFELVSPEIQQRRAIYAPASAVPGLQEAIDSLRESGEIVISELPGQQGGAAEMGCDRELAIEKGAWKVRKI